MTDTLTPKPKLQLRSGLSFSEKIPSPSATKLMINHGKPNFTIQRTPKSPQMNGNKNPLSPSPTPTPPKTPNAATSPIHNGNGGSLTIINNNNNNEITFKNANVNGQTRTEISVKTQNFNGVVKPANLPLTAEQENEAAKVVLRHVQQSRDAGVATKTRAPLSGDEDDTVPEFIRRQRQIQQRLAKDNILDFENRRSGYFTQVLISPTTPNQRTSFVETMSSPAIVPSLEMPPPMPTTTPPPAPKQAEPLAVEEELISMAPEAPVAPVAPAAAAAVIETNNGHAEEEEVAKAIEEVNKAVAGEDDGGSVATANETEELVQIATPTIEKEAEVKAAAADAVGEIVQAAVVQVEETLENGHADGDAADVTISHTNGQQGPSIPTPDPSGSLGVNYEPKTVVSFSKDLGTEINKYPDTVKVETNGDGNTTSAAVDDDLAELAKLKFDIKADEQDVQVTPVLRAE